MGRALGQNMIIENIGGAGGSTALAKAARAEPDGYTIAIGNAGTNAATYTIYPKLPFTPNSFCSDRRGGEDLRRDCAAQGFSGGRPCKNFSPTPEPSRQGRLGHAGVGSSNYLICKSFVQAAGVDTTLVSYRGAAPALTDAIGGQTDGVCDGAASVSGSIRRKLVRGLVVGSNVRLSTCLSADLGGSRHSRIRVAGLERLVRAKRHATELIARLNAAARESVESDAVKKRFADLSTVAPDANEHAPEVLQQLVTRDVAKYRKLLQ